MFVFIHSASSPLFLQEIFAVGIQNQLEVSRSRISGVDRKRKCGGGRQQAAVLPR